MMSQKHHVRYLERSSKHLGPDETANVPTHINCKLSYDFNGKGCILYGAECEKVCSFICSPLSFILFHFSGFDVFLVDLGCMMIVGVST